MAISIKEIKETVERLPDDQLKEFRAWYEEFDSGAWDRQIEQDVSQGRLDRIVDQAVADYKAGRAKELFRD